MDKDDLDGFAGALMPSESKDLAWFSGWSVAQAIRFTVAHECGHYFLHRQKYPAGVSLDEAGVDGRAKIQIEREANDFASSLLMPLDDFRKQISARDKPDSTR